MGVNRGWGEGGHAYEQRVVYGSAESLFCTLETDITMYVSYAGIKSKTLKKLKM